MSTNPLYFFDTSIAILWCQEHKSDTEKKNFEKCMFLFQDIAKQNAKIIISTDVLTEILVGIDDNRVNHIRDFLTQAYIIAPFDELAAIECSQLIKNLGYKEKLPNNIMDLRIMATAKSRGVSKIFTEDINFIKTAKKLSISAEALPQLPDSQSSLLALCDDPEETSSSK